MDDQALLAILLGGANYVWLAQQRLEAAQKSAEMVGAVKEALNKATELQAQTKWPEALGAAERAEKLLAVAPSRRPPNVRAKSNFVLVTSGE